MAEHTTLDKTAILEELIEYDPELRDVLSRPGITRRSEPDYCRGGDDHR